MTQPTQDFRNERDRHPAKSPSSDVRDNKLGADETPGDDRLVARGFWRSVLVMFLLALITFAIVQWRTKPAAIPGSANNAGSPIAPPSAGVTPSAGVVFDDVSQQALGAFAHTSGARGAKLLPECLSGGVAIVDLDGDGKLDLVFAQGQPLEPAAAADGANRGGIQVFRNITIQQGAIRFEAIELPDPLARAMYANAIAVGDINGDGRTDLFVTTVGRNRLLLNQSSGEGSIAFFDASDAWNVPRDDQWSTSAGMFDADSAGDLDVVVKHYVEWSPTIVRAVDYRLDGIGRAYGPPSGFEGTSLSLLLNDGVTLRDATLASGVAITNPVTGAPYGKTLGLAFVDADRDGRTDILVANDRTPKFLLRNMGVSDSGVPHFADIATEVGFAYDRDGSATGAMGIDFAWPRNNAELAVAVGNFANEPSSLYIAHPSAGRGELTFSDEALGQGFGAPTRRFLTFGMLFVDVDLDGDEDLLQANGHLEPEIARIQPSQTYAQRGQLFENRGAESVPLFVEAAPELTGALATPAVGRALAWGDLDRDGDPDLVLTDLGSAPRVLVNQQTRGNHWIAIALNSGNKPGRALSAEVEIDAVIGGVFGERKVTQRRTISPTRSYLSQCEAVAHFGLGQATRVDEVRVRSSDGVVTTLNSVRIDALTTINLE